MKHKRKGLIGVFSILAILLMIVIPTLSQIRMDDVMSDWGKLLKGYSDYREGMEEKVVFKGKTATITEVDLEQATDFYILSGKRKEKAEEAALNFMKEKEALYEEAIRSGFAVSDEEVKEYLEEMKKTIASAENKEDAYAVMRAFDSEEEYWEYQHTVAKKSLPIQKWEEHLKTEYREERLTNLKKSLRVKDKSDFDTFLKQYIEKLIEEEDYQKVN